MSRASRKNNISEMHLPFFTKVDHLEVFDGSGVIKDEIGKLQKFFFLVSPMVNLGEKEKVHLQKFVLTGRPM